MGRSILAITASSRCATTFAVDVRMRQHGCGGAIRIERRHAHTRFDGRNALDRRETETSRVVNRAVQCLRTAALSETFHKGTLGIRLRLRASCFVVHGALFGANFRSLEFRPALSTVQLESSSPDLLPRCGRNQHHFYSPRFNAESLKTGMRSRGDVVSGHKLDLVSRNWRTG